MIGLLTGAIGSGKTTAAARVAALAGAQGITCGGLLCPALFDASGVKTGICGLDLLTGEHRTLARIGRDLRGPGVGPYSFDAAALAWAVCVIDSAVGRCDLLIVDEIGRLELEAGAGLAPVLSHLATVSSQRWLVLVRESLLLALQRRLAPADLAVFRLRPDDRDALPAEILAWAAGCRPGRE